MIKGCASVGGDGGWLSATFREAQRKNERTDRLEVTLAFNKATTRRKGEMNTVARANVLERHLPGAVSHFVGIEVGRGVWLESTILR